MLVSTLHSSNQWLACSIWHGSSSPTAAHMHTLIRVVPDNFEDPFTVVVTKGEVTFQEKNCSLVNVSTTDQFSAELTDLQFDSNVLSFLSSPAEKLLEEIFTRWFLITKIVEKFCLPTTTVGQGLNFVSEAISCYT